MTDDRTSGQPSEPRAEAPGAEVPAPRDEVAASRAGVPASRPGAAASRDEAAVPSPFAGALRGLDSAIGRGLARVTGRPVAPYQSAVIRIGFALTWLLFLLREWPHRDELYGPGSPWSWDMARSLIASNHAFTVLLWSDSRVWFEIVYTVAILASAALMLGWRTRTSALLFMIGVLSLQNRSVFEGDGGDNVIHIMAIYLLFTRCGQVWSLDARRARRRRERDPRRAARDPYETNDVVGVAAWTAAAIGLLVVCALGDLSMFWASAFYVALALQGVWWLLRKYAQGEPRAVMEMVANVVHAGAMLVIVVEVCFIYATAGWYKIQGSRWEDGTALYYPLHLNDFTPWPALSHLMSSNGVVVMLITYGTVIVQVAFPFTLFNRRVKNVLLVAMMCEHAAIAVTLGLPFFSLAMITADAVFLPTGFLRWAGDRLVRTVSRGDRPAVPAQRDGERPRPATADTLPG